MQIDENGQSDINIDDKIKRQKTIQPEELGFKFIRIDPKKEDSNIFKDMNKRVTREWEGGGLPCPLLETGKSCHNIQKKCPENGHVWSSPALKTSWSHA